MYCQHIDFIHSNFSAVSHPGYPASRSIRANVTFLLFASGESVGLLVVKKAGRVPG